MAVPAMKTASLNKTGQNSDVFRKIPDKKVPVSKGTQALNVLNEILPSSANAVSSEIGRVVEEDKTRQTALAETDKLSSPTEDATKAGRQAHKNVRTRNGVSTRMRDLALEATQFEGSSPDLKPEEKEAEWAEYVIQVQGELVEQYGDTPQDIEMVGSLFRDILPKVADTRHATAFKQEEVRKYRDTFDSLAIATDPAVFSAEEAEANVVQLFAEAKKMKMTQESTRRAFVDATVAAAGRNDLTLLNIAKKIGIYKQEPSMANAERQAQGRLQQEDQATVAGMKTVLIEELSKSPNMTEQQFYDRAGAQLNNGQPIWSEVQMRQEWKKQKQAHDETFARQSDLMASMEVLYDENAIPVSLSHYSAARKKLLISDYDEYSKQRMAMELEGLDATKDADLINKIGTKYENEKAMWLTGNNIRDENWANDFKSLQTQSLSQFEGEELPPFLMKVLDRMTMLEASPGAISLHADATTIGIYENYKKNLAGSSTPVAALRDAQELSRLTAIKLTEAESKTFNSAVTKGVNELLTDTSIFPKFLTGNSEDADWATIKHTNALVDTRARELQVIGKLDVPTSVSRAIQEIGDTHYQLDNGALVFGNDNWLSSEIGVPAHQISTALTLFKQGLVDNPEFTLNATGDPDSWRPEISKGGNVVWRDTIGNIVTKPVTLGEVGGTSHEMRLSKLWEEREALHNKRMAKQEAMSKPYNELFEVPETNYKGYE